MIKEGRVMTRIPEKPVRVAGPSVGRVRSVGSPRSPHADGTGCLSGVGAPRRPGAPIGLPDAQVRAMARVFNGIQEQVEPRTTNPKLLATLGIKPGDVANSGLPVNQQALVLGLFRS